MKLPTSLLLCSTAAILCVVVTNAADNNTALQEAKAKRAHEMTLLLMGMGVPAVTSRCTAESPTPIAVGTCLKEAYANRP